MYYVEDVRPYLDLASVVVVPLRVGGGTRLKILEALAMAKPVVTTTLGAEGIDVAPGRDLLVADDAPSFAEATLAALASAELRFRLGTAGRELAERKYGWDAIGRRLETVYEACLSARRMRRDALSQETAVQSVRSWSRPRPEPRAERPVR